MSGIQQTLLGGSPAGYQIERSLRFNSADSAYLNSTPSSAATNSGIWTVSFWCKRSTLGTLQRVIATSPNSGSNVTEISFQTDNTLYCQIATSAGGGASRYMQTTQVFRDVGAWMHFVLAFDRNQATASNRLRLYVNGTEVTAFSTDQRSSIANTDNSGWNTQSIAQYIGRAWTAANYIDGYLTEFYSIDGQQLTPSSFGETDSATGVWKPKAYTGTYGTNGFYLNFSDNSNTTAATLGKDSSGNGNNWTPNLFSVTAGAGNDSLVDTPTPYGTDTGVGGEVRGNYCTANAVDLGSVAAPTNGNLAQTLSGTNGTGASGTFTVTTGKWYWEVTSNATTNAAQYVGVIRGALPSTAGPTTNPSGFYYGASGNNREDGTTVTYGNSWTNLGVDYVIGVALDCDANTVVFYVNNVSQGTRNLPSTTSGWKPQLGFNSSSGSAVMNYNFGQRPFAYTAPSGFKALCTQNLPTPTIGATSTTQAGKYFDIDVYTGIAGTYTKTGLGFQPDLIWGKARNAAAAHRLVDAVRGGTLKLTTSSTDAESTDVAAYTFTSDGYSIPGGVNHNNNTGTTYAAWLWKANGAGSSNTDGTITSTVSANTTAGFSIATFTMPASGTSDTVGHGLGVAPAMVIVKSRGSSSWGVYHKNLTSAAYYLTLQTTNGETSSNSYWNSTAPTSTVFTLGATWYGAGTMVAYSFAPIAGYSAFGSYSGNNSSTDGTFVYLGFRPRFIMIKSTSAGTDWVMMDSARNTYNLADTSLYANSSSSESTIGTVNDIDFLSNGFKLRNNTGFVNASQTYVYAAFAESPFKYSLAR